MNTNERIMKNKNSEIVSANTGLVSDALAKVQAEFGVFENTSKAYSFNYLDLAGILKIVLPIMGKHNLSLYQTMRVEVKDDTPWVYVTARLGCGAEWYETDLGFPMMNARKGMTEDLMLLGSTGSFLRRYQVQTILGISGSDVKEVEQIVDDEARPNPNEVKLK